MKEATPRSFVLAILGPSGVGKSATRQILRHLDTRFELVPALTTRLARADDIDRICVSDSDFDKLYSNEEFLPQNTIYGARYATPKAPIRAALAVGAFPLLDWPLSMLGQLKAAFPGRVFAAYLKPPSIRELARRLTLDGRDATEDRLNKAIRELSQFRGASDCGIDFVATAWRDREYSVAETIYRRFIAARFAASAPPREVR